MSRGARTAAGVLVGAAAFAALLYPSFYLNLLAMRETYRIAEVTRIMHRTANLGGQVMGYNYPRDPQWMHPAARFIGAAVGYGPALVVALLVFDRVAFGPLRATLCGHCGRRLKNLARPECPTCSAPF